MQNQVPATDDGVSALDINCEECVHANEKVSALLKPRNLHACMHATVTEGEVQKLRSRGA